MADEPQDSPAPAKAAPGRDATTNEGGGTTAPAAAPAAAKPAPPAAKPAPGGGDLSRRGFFSWAAVA